MGDSSLESQVELTEFGPFSKPLAFNSFFFFIYLWKYKKIKIELQFQKKN